MEGEWEGIFAMEDLSGTGGDAGSNKGPETVDYLERAHDAGAVGDMDMGTALGTEIEQMAEQVSQDDATFGFQDVHPDESNC